MSKIKFMMLKGYNIINTWQELREYTEKKNTLEDHLDENILKKLEKMRRNL